MIKVAINGFGRIGRPVLKIILAKYSQEIEVVAINDLTEPATLAHLLKYDSIYGIYDQTVQAGPDFLEVAGQKIKVFAEKDPEKLPWQKLAVDVVLECTGYFTDQAGASKHLTAGAKKVILSAPSKGEGIPNFVLGVNQDKYDPSQDNVVSMASCTTNCLAPVAKVIQDNFEIETGLMTTIHSYTNDQRLLDLPHKDLRRARAAALSMIPTTTGAAIAVTKVIPELQGKIDGLAIRIPTPVVSVVDFVAKVKKETSVEEVNKTLKEAATQKELVGILGVEEAKLVSIDFRGNPLSSIVDASSTMVQNGHLIKIIAWYDNEFGYSNRLADFTKFIGEKL